MSSISAAPAGERARSAAALAWIVCVCDGRRFGLPLERVRGILDPRPLTRLPGCGPAVGGLMNVRGRIVTVFDLGTVLSLRSSIAVPDHRLILVKHDGRTAAFAVEQVPAVARTGACDPVVPPRALRGLAIESNDVVGLGAHDGQAFLAVDPTPLLERLLA